MTFISPYFSYAELTFREMQEEMLSKLVPAVVMLVLGVLEALGGLSAPNNPIICPWNTNETGRNLLVAARSIYH